LIGSVAINANAESSTINQNYKIHVDKGDSVIGKYSIIIRNTATDVINTKKFVDTEDGSQFVYTIGTISAQPGDELQACFMIQSNEEMDCDYKIANENKVLNFYVDKAHAY